MLSLDNCCTETVFLERVLIVRLSLLRKTILIPEYLAFMCVCVFVDGCTRLVRKLLRQMCFNL